MISVVFPGQGSQTVGMASSLYENYGYIKDFFALADETLKYPISKLILKGPVEELNKTENTQPAIFIVSYSIFETIKKEKNIDLSKIKFLAGHSLGEYSALACSGSLEYEQTIKLLKIRGKAMQTAVPDGRGGMVAVLGSNIETVKEILFDNKKNFECYIANDNSDGQIVLSGLNGDLVSLIEELKKKGIKNIKLPVSAPFHCKLMRSATDIMKNQIKNTEFKNPFCSIVSNVTAKDTKDKIEIKQLLIKQIENPVRWRESVLHLSKNGITKILEIGPGKVLSGLIKRIDKSISVNSINTQEDIDNINFDV
jgi:[acyl-carrier-protein] S-malonyltransferase|tara:strand:+ start:751 stop:1683 length:933 start_codon:yes stop_codon:yes gene_type:complete